MLFLLQILLLGLWYGVPALAAVPWWAVFSPAIVVALQSLFLGFVALLVTYR